jgi:SNF2 family DNA or RNA helicase
MVAGGVGVTLTKAHTEIIIDYSWVPADMAQVEDRICRSGQTECCMIYYVYCNNSVFDQVFIRMLSDKSSNIDTVVDGAEEGENSYNLTAEKLENSTYMDLLKAEIKAKAPEKPKRSRKKKSVGKE